MLVSSFTGIEEVKSKMNSLGYYVEEMNKERYNFEELLVIAGTIRPRNELNLLFRI